MSLWGEQSAGERSRSWPDGAGLRKWQELSRPKIRPETASSEGPSEGYRSQVPRAARRRGGTLQWTQPSAKPKGFKVWLGCGRSTVAPPNLRAQQGSSERGPVAIPISLFKFKLAFQSAAPAQRTGVQRRMPEGARSASDGFVRCNTLLGRAVLRQGWLFRALVAMTSQEGEQSSGPRPW